MEFSKQKSLLDSYYDKSPDATESRLISTGTQLQEEEATLLSFQCCP